MFAVVTGYGGVLALLWAWEACSCPESMSPATLALPLRFPGMQGSIAATKPLLLVDAALVPVRLYSLPGGFDQLPPLFHGRFLGQRPRGPKAISYQSLCQHLHRRLYTQYARCLREEGL
jgi:hypothetical protein